MDILRLRLVYAGLQVPSDEEQDAFVLHFPRHPRHEGVVVNPVEELLHIQVHHPGMALSDVALGRPDSIVGAPSRSEAKALFREVGVFGCIGLCLVLQTRPGETASPWVRGPRVGDLPPASFRFRLAADTLAFG